jgi:hypothetical protein
MFLTVSLVGIRAEDLKEGIVAASLFCVTHPNTQSATHHRQM